MTISGGNPTSYFSTPSSTLDPTLFEGRAIKSWVRTGILSILNDFLSLRYRHPDLWAHAWLAGSGVSYQWESAREPGDLDCLVGVNYVQFRKANPAFAGLTDREVADQLNEEFRDELYGQTENWNGYELTFYVNPGASDIRSIKPYAAYDLKYNEWTVSPDPQQTAQYNQEWETVVSADRSKAEQASIRFTGALNDVRIAHNDALRRNAETKLWAAGHQAMALYQEIHTNRSMAFSPQGSGYGDFHNYRWQAAKREGTINTLRTMREHLKNISSASAAATYGVDLPSADVLVRRAATYRNSL
jgi:hypothetical protein